MQRKYDFFLPVSIISLLISAALLTIKGSKVIIFLPECQISCIIFLWEGLSFDLFHNHALTLGGHNKPAEDNPRFTHNMIRTKINNYDRIQIPQKEHLNSFPILLSYKVRLSLKTLIFKSHATMDSFLNRLLLNILKGKW